MNEAQNHLIEEPAKVIDYLKFLNTFGIALVLFLAGSISLKVDKLEVKIDAVASVQAVQAVELMRMKTVQEINVKNVGDLHNRVFNLEIKDSQKK